MRDVCIHAISPQKDVSVGYLGDCTNEDGSFSITELPVGNYILVVNKDGQISNTEPFKTFYYPNVSERERAAVINIGIGDVVENLNIYVPKVEERITVEGILLYSDGKPAVNENIQFKAEKTVDGLEGDARAKTDSNGRFKIKILKNLKGQLFGNMYAFIGEFENCPKLEKLIKATGRTLADINTTAIDIQTDDNIYNVELKFPFPGCKKAKIE